MDNRNARYSILNAVAAAASISMIQPYIKKMAIEMGATNLQLGYISSWPSLVSVIAVLFAASAVARSRNKKRLIAAIFLLGRTAALGAAMVPMFPAQYRVWVLIGFWVSAVFPQSAAGTVQQSFLADVFPTEQRERAFASRQAWATLAAGTVGILSGILLDRVFGSPIGYQIMFVGSFVVALAEIFFFLRMKEQDQLEFPIQTETHGWRAYSAVFQHRPFVLFLLCSVPFHFTWMMVWPLFDRYTVTYMHANNTWVQMITLANSGGAFFAYPLWGSVARRYGNGIVLGYSALFLVTAPVLTAAATNVGWLAAVNLFTGLGGAGVLILVLNNLLEVSPAQGRSHFLAVHAALISLTGTIGPILGAFMMEHMEIRLGLTLSSGARLITCSSFFILHFWYRRRQGNRFIMEKTTIR